MTSWNLNKAFSLALPRISRQLRRPEILFSWLNVTAVKNHLVYAFRKVRWCLHEKTLHRCEFHTGMTVWFRITFTRWLGHFISRYLKVHFMFIKYTCASILVPRVRRFLDTWPGCKLSRVALGTRMVWFKIANIAHALPVPVCRQTDLTPKRVVVSRLHDNVARFRTGVKFSPWYNNRGELTPGWLASAWHFVVVSCKQI